MLRVERVKKSKRRASRKVKPKLGAEIKNMVKSIVNQPVERKYFDQSLAGGIPYTGAITCISDVTRGNEVTQRIGNQITLKEIQMRLYFYLNDNVEHTAIRYLVLVDRQGYNTPVVTDVLESGLVGTTYTPICPYEWSYMHRFKILKDEVVVLTKGGPQQAASRTFSIPLGNTKSFHIGASTTFSNQIYLLQIGNEANVLDLSTMMYHSRLIYTDE